LKTSLLANDIHKIPYWNTNICTDNLVWFTPAPSISMQWGYVNRDRDR
jgi:hypothetical protein